MARDSNQMPLRPPDRVGNFYASIGWSQRRNTSRIRVGVFLVTFLCCCGFDAASAFTLDHRGTISSISLDISSHGIILRGNQSCLRMAKGEDSKNNNEKKKKKRVVKIDRSNASSGPSRVEMELTSRMTKLEALVAKQEIEIQQLRRQCGELAEAAAAFSKVVELLRQAGLQDEDLPSQPQQEESEEKNDEDEKKEELVEGQPKAAKLVDENATVEYFDDSDIFGRAPSSVIDAADAAGAAILAGMLGGKQRMLVDVRDAELSRDPETLVQFIELAILPVAAGLEGLKSTRNRVKIVFPTVSQLLEYRRTMALSAPEVVALSTLGFDPVEKQDKMVVLVAPAPDDEEGMLAMNELLEPTGNSTSPLQQPLVVLNYHMVPVSGPAALFEVAYHLRLLNVQFMTGESAPQYFQKWEDDLKKKMERKAKANESEDAPDDVLYGPESDPESSKDSKAGGSVEDDAALEAAMKHAHELGVNQGVTRAMVIRAYPRPWHVFVDTSPDTDADFEVAATFDEEPTQDDVNYAIVECLEGSETEDELVAQQMQQALEAGQLDRVSEMLGLIPGFEDATEAPDDKAAEQQESEEQSDGDDASNDAGASDGDKR